MLVIEHLKYMNIEISIKYVASYVLCMSIHVCIYTHIYIYI